MGPAPNVSDRAMAAICRLPRADLGFPPRGQGNRAWVVELKTVLMESIVQDWNTLRASALEVGA